MNSYGTTWLKSTAKIAKGVFMGLVSVKFGSVGLVAVLSTANCWMLLVPSIDGPFCDAKNTRKKYENAKKLSLECV